MNFARRKEQRGRKLIQLWQEFVFSWGGSLKISRQDEQDLFEFQKLGCCRSYEEHIFFRGCNDPHQFRAQRRVRTNKSADDEGGRFE